MPELDPADSALLALDQDAATGVAYIPTGQSPYHLHFRRMLHRLLRAAERANDLRVYQTDALGLGVRGGRCVIAGQPREVAPVEGITVNADTTTHVWLDANGNIITGEAGLPADRTAFLPLARVVTDAEAIQSIDDLRGEAFLQAPSLAALHLAATPGEINQALDGIGAAVTAAALSALCAGPSSNANAYHLHSRFTFDADAPTALTLVNDHAGASAAVGLTLSLPQHLPHDTTLDVDPANGDLRQTHDGVTRHLLGALPITYVEPGEIAAPVTQRLAGVVPIDGSLTALVLSLGTNTESSDTADGISATVRINGSVLTTTAPAITAADGPGFRSTARGDGTPATLKTDGTADVQRGDLITVELLRTANGSITTNPADAAVLLILRPHRAE
ncbi:MAG: hypothetical protein GVY24_03340 [Planctomycetes bacterium]|jgi:hypothetical protein|nr:hypothetical protein [Planctomycetota bacterium]